MTQRRLAQAASLLATVGAFALGVYSLSTGDSAIGIGWVAVAIALGGATWLRVRRSMT